MDTTEKDFGTGWAASGVRRAAPCRDPRSGVDFVLFAVFAVSAILRGLARSATGMRKVSTPPS